MYNKPTNAEEMEEFERMTTGFDYVYEDTVGAGKIIYLCQENHARLNYGRKSKKTML